MDIPKITRNIVEENVFQRKALTHDKDGALIMTLLSALTEI